MPEGQVKGCELGCRPPTLETKNVPMLRRQLPGTQGMKSGEFVGTVLCLGRGRVSLLGNALLRAMIASVSKTRGNLVKFRVVGDANVNVTAA